MSLSLIPALAHRALIPELMDDPAVDVHGLFAGLRYLERINLLPGGAGLMAGLLLAERDRWDPRERLRLVDVGTGGADVPRALVQMLARVGQPAQVTGVDLHARTLDYARERCAAERRVTLVRGDALALPFASGAVDYAVSTTFLHHLDDDQARRCLAEMRRIARRGVVVVDLERTRLAWLGIRIATMFSTPVARHDGPVSVQRAFRPDELLALARDAGLPEPRMSRHVPFRQALVSSW